MKVVDMVTRVIRDALQQQAAKLKSSIEGVRDEVDRRFKFADEARGLLERKHELELSEVRKSLSAAVEVKSITEKLAGEIAGLRAEREAERKSFEQGIKAADDARQALEEKHQAELAEVRKSLEEKTGLIEALSAKVEKSADHSALAKAIEVANESAVSLAKRLDEQAASLTAVVEKQEAAEASNKTIEVSFSHSIDQIKDFDRVLGDLRKALRERDEKLSALEKAVSETAEEVQSAGATLKALSSLEIPQIPDAVVKMPDRLVEIEKAIATLDTKSKGFLHFAGQWDEGEEYKEGAAVAHKNAAWVATRDTKGTPGEPDSGWKMWIKAAKLLTGYEHR